MRVFGGAIAVGYAAIAFAVGATHRKRRAPLLFSKGMGEAVAGRPIVIRFVDDRAIDSSKRQS